MNTAMQWKEMVMLRLYHARLSTASTHRLLSTLCPLLAHMLLGYGRTPTQSLHAALKEAQNTLLLLLEQMQQAIAAAAVQLLCAGSSSWLTA
jgi:hypothetical protein